MRISIIILSWQRPEETLAAVASARRQHYRNREIIVWDNASTEHCRQALQDGLAGLSGVRLILADRNYGPSRGRNLAVARASGDALVFLDSDSELVSDDSLDKLHEALVCFVSVLDSALPSRT